MSALRNPLGSLVAPGGFFYAPSMRATDWFRRLLFHDGTSNQLQPLINATSEAQQLDIKERQLRFEIELERARAEIEEIRARTRRVERDHRLLENKREGAAKARSQKGQKVTCRVCQNPSDITLTAGEILFHNGGHGGPTPNGELSNSN